MGDSADISVLLPVYRGVDPGHLARALESICSQTLQPREVVLVEDGPLDAEHHSVIEVAGLPGLRRVRLEQNRGAGVANQAGLAVATSTWIAKCDADDVNLPERFRREYDALVGAGADLCGAAMLEFVDNEDNVRGIRRTPATHDAILRRMRVNNPVNHPSVMYRRAAALDAGGYPDWRYVQDYGLFARMAANGARMINLQEPLVLFRSGDQLTSRRRSAQVRRGEVVLQRCLRDLGLISTPRMLFNVVWRLAFRMMPASLVELAYRRVLSRPVPLEEA